MTAPNPQPTERPRRLAPPEECALARDVAHFVTALDPSVNIPCALMLVAAAFPGIKLRTALIGFLSRELVKLDRRVLQ
jgi:hypothetical protein